MSSKISTRTEKDSLGLKEIPSHVYYGIQTARAVENFPISGLRAHPTLIRAIAMVKEAAALANRELGLVFSERDYRPDIQIIEFIVERQANTAGFDMGAGDDELRSEGVLDPRGMGAPVGDSEGVGLFVQTDLKIPIGCVRGSGGRCAQAQCEKSLRTHISL